MWISRKTSTESRSREHPVTIIVGRVVAVELSPIVGSTDSDSSASKSAIPAKYGIFPMRAGRHAPRLWRVRSLSRKDSPLMDPGTFDTLARSLASTSRRTILRRLASTAVGGLLVPVLGEAATDAHNLSATCKKKSGKARKKCLRKARKHATTHVTEPRCTTPESCPVPASQPCAQATCVNGRCGIAPRTANATCEAATCDGTLFTPQTFCTGSSATCPSSPPSQNCSPYTCRATDYRLACEDDNHCDAPFFCEVISCLPRRLTGESCVRPRQCLFGQCVGGVCCTEACPSGNCPGGICSP